MRNGRCRVRLAVDESVHWLTLSHQVQMWGGMAITNLGRMVHVCAHCAAFALDVKLSLLRSYLPYRYVLASMSQFCK
jgi:hypothetical protein